MKKDLFIIILCTTLFSVFLGSCNDDYYDIDDVSYSVIVSDTVYLNTPIIIKGEINQPLDIKVYLGNWNEDNLIGILKHYSDSIVWTPENLKEGTIHLVTEVDFETKKNHEFSKRDGVSFFVKRKTEEQ